MVRVYGIGFDQLEKHAIGLAAAKWNPLIPKLVGFGDLGLGFSADHANGVGETDDLHHKCKSR